MNSTKQRHGLPVVPDDADAAAQIFRDRPRCHLVAVASEHALIHDRNTELFLDHGNNGVVIIDLVINTRFETGSLEGTARHVELTLVKKDERCLREIAQAHGLFAC